MEDTLCLCPLPLPPETSRHQDGISDTHDSSNRRNGIMPQLLPSGIQPPSNAFFPINYSKRSVLVSEIRIVVEPWCSENSWLKLVLRQNTVESAWTMKDLDSAFISDVLPHYKTKQLTVEFQAPSGGFRLAAFLVLRAKLYDVCRLLDFIATQETPLLSIWFREPPSEVRSRWRQSFWEDRPQIAQASRANRRKARQNGFNSTRSFIEYRRRYLYFYEFLMLPLIAHPLWRNASIRFDQEPRRLKTSVLMEDTGILHDDWLRESFIGPGYKALSLVNWALCQQLIDEGRMPKQQYSCDMTYLESCRNSADFDFGYHIWEDRYWELLQYQSDTLCYDIDSMLDIISGSPVAKDLRSAISRISRTSKSSFNTLFGPRSNKYLLDYKIDFCIDEEGDEDFGPVSYDEGEGKGQWRWIASFVKKAYRVWADGRDIYKSRCFIRCNRPLPEPEKAGWSILDKLPPSLTPTYVKRD